MYNYQPPMHHLLLLFVGMLSLTTSCRSGGDKDPPTLTWYVFDEPSGAFREDAEHYSKMSAERYAIAPLHTDTDQQREQLVHRLAAADPDIDIIGLDAIWTAEFAEAG